MESKNVFSSIEADLWVFDNDGTLYNNPADLEVAVVALMEQYISVYYGIDIKDAGEKRKQLLQKHNTKYTLIALIRDGVLEDDFIQRTYLSINPSDFGVVKSPELERLIGSLEGEKIVLTNNPSEFAELILNSLGTRHLFSKIIGMREMNYIQKPDIRAFELLKPWLEQKKNVVVVDDCLRNIQVAMSMGCITVNAKGGLM